jgi:hypothetical protein
MRTRLAVGRVIVYCIRVGGLDKTGGPFSKNTSLEPGFSQEGIASVCQVRSCLSQVFNIFNPAITCTVQGFII